MSDAFMHAMHMKAYMGVASLQWSGYWQELDFLATDQKFDRIVIGRVAVEPEPFRIKLDRFGKFVCRHHEMNDFHALRSVLFDRSKQAAYRFALKEIRTIVRIWLCAEHDRQLGGESPLSSLMVAKD
jgi:hypothetical protein